MVSDNHRLADSSFGSQLRTLRERRGISLRDLAHLLTEDHGYPIGHGHLGKVERRTRTASRELANRCDTALNAHGVLSDAWEKDNAVVAIQPAQLPAVIGTLVGRDQELRRIAEYLTAATAPARSSSTVIVIDGPPGVGKTTLALRCADDAADRFPDGILFADLRAYSDLAAADPTDVLEQFLLALGVSAAMIPRTADARASLYRTVLRRRRVLIVLDNAKNSDQVRPLLPNAPGCCVLVTSRQRLSGLSVRHGAVVIDLAPLAADQAVLLLRAVIGDRVDAEPDAATALARTCSCLPLALRVAAERVASRPQTTLAGLVEDLTHEADQLALLTMAEDISLELRSVFSWSYKSLDPETAFLFRIVSLHWGTDISLEAAAALAGWRTLDTRARLDILVGSHLLQETEHHRFRFHDLLRVYAAELNQTEDDKARRQQAVDQLLTWYLASVHAASRVMAPYRQRPDITVPTGNLSVAPISTWDAAVTWYERELPALTVATRQALDSGVPAVAHDLPIALWDFFFLRKPWTAWIRMNEHGLAAARATNNHVAEAWALYNLGVASLDLGDFIQARDMFTQSLNLRRQAGRPGEQAWSTLCLANARSALGDPRAAAELLEQALETFINIDDRWAVGICRGYIGGTYTLLDQFDDALTQLKESEHILREVGDRQGEGCALDLLAKVHLGQQEWDGALDYLHRAIALRSDIGDRRGQAGTLFTLGKVQRDGGKLADALESLQHALRLFTELGDPEADTVGDHVQTVEVALANSRVAGHHSTP